MFDFSLDEQDTGMRWVDDEPVYQRTFTAPLIPNLPNNAQVNYAHGLDIGVLVDLFGVADNGTQYFPLPFAHTGAANIVGLWADRTNITLQTGTNRVAFNRVYVTLLYTKAGS